MESFSLFGAIRWIRWSDAVVCLENRGEVGASYLSASYSKDFGKSCPVNDNWARETRK